MYEPAGTTDARRGAGGRAGSDEALPRRLAGGAPQHRHDFPELQPAGATHGTAQRAVPAGADARGQADGTHPRHAAAGAGGTCRQGVRLPGTVVRRAEAAGGNRAGTCHQPALPAVRRGNLRAGSDHDGLHSGAPANHQPHAGRDRCGHHARDGGGGSHLPQGGGDRQQPHRGNGRGGCDIRQPAFRHCAGADPAARQGGGDRPGRGARPARLQRGVYLQAAGVGADPGDRRPGQHPVCGHA